VFIGNPQVHKSSTSTVARQRPSSYNQHYMFTLLPCSKVDKPHMCSGRALITSMVRQRATASCCCMDGPLSQSHVQLQRAPSQKAAFNYPTTAHCSCCIIRDCSTQLPSMIHSCVHNRSRTYHHPIQTAHAHHQCYHVRRTAAHHFTPAVAVNISCSCSCCTVPYVLGTSCRLLQPQHLLAQLLRCL
jgi:hypothetical protein